MEYPGKFEGSEKRSPAVQMETVMVSVVIGSWRNKKRSLIGEVR
jgi:hypothetical protein